MEKYGKLSSSLSPLLIWKTGIGGIAEVRHSKCFPFLCPQLKGSKKANCFLVVHPCILLESIHLSHKLYLKNHDVRVLKFHMYIHHQKIAETEFFLVQIVSHFGTMPPWNPGLKIAPLKLK